MSIQVMTENPIYIQLYPSQNELHVTSQYEVLLMQEIFHLVEMQIFARGEYAADFTQKIHCVFA